MVEQGKRGTIAAVGEAAADLLERATGGTASCKPVTERLLLPDAQQLTVLETPRLEDQQIAELRKAANLPLPMPERCPDDRFVEAMRSLTILPRRADDLVTGELRLKLYRWQLAKFEEAAINFLVKEALATCKWFPTPAECLQILSRRDGPVERARKARASASGQIRREMQQRFLDWTTRLQRGELTQGEVDAAPPRWWATGETQGWLRKDADGRYLLRTTRREAA